MDYDEKPNAPNRSRDAWAERAERLEKERDAACAERDELRAALRAVLKRLTKPSIFVEPAPAFATLAPIAVTITGADDRVDIDDLIERSYQFPWVEWGVLISIKRQGTSRYPSIDWLNTLATKWLDAQHETPCAFRLAAHFCGATARDTIAGDPQHLDVPYMRAFRRVQLNGYVAGTKHEWHAGGPLRRLANHRDRFIEFILQARTVDDLHEALLDATNIGRASVLFDASGGRGIGSDGGWPEDARDVTGFDVPIGYAGGIGPDNVHDVLSAVGKRKGMWIDMESGVRTPMGAGPDVDRLADRFDLTRVDQVLLAVQQALETGVIVR